MKSTPTAFVVFESESAKKAAVDAAPGRRKAGCFRKEATKNGERLKVVFLQRVFNG